MDTEIGFLAVIKGQSTRAGGRMGNPSLGFPTAKPSPDGLASLPELLECLDVSPIEMGEEGLRPSTPPPFEKGGRKLYGLARASRFLKERLEHGVRKWVKFLYFVAGGLGSFRENP